MTLDTQDIMIGGEHFRMQNLEQLSDDSRHVHLGSNNLGTELTLVGLSDDDIPLVATYTLSHITIAFGLHRKGDDLHTPSGLSNHTVYADAELYQFANSPHPAVHDGDVEPEYLVVDGESFDVQSGHARELWDRAQDGGHNDDYIFCNGYDDGQPTQHQYEAFWFATKVETPEGTLVDYLSSKSSPHPQIQ